MQTIIKNTNKARTSCIIRNTLFDIDFTANTKGIFYGDIRIVNMYGLKNSGFYYILAILSNGTYRLYSKSQKKLYVKGATSTIKWISEGNKEIH